MKTQIRRQFYLFCFVFLFFSLAGSVLGQEIPLSRTFNSAWQHAGYPGDIIIPDTMVNVRDSGALGNGTTNDQPAVAVAIASLGGTPGVIYFPSGTYLIQSPIIVPSGVVLCGQNPKDTTLLFDFTDHAIKIYGSETGLWIPLTEPVIMHENTIIISDSSSFSVGDYALIRQENDSSWNITDAWADYSAGQVVRTITIAGNTLTLESPLRHSYPLIRNPEIRRINANKNSGVDNLKLQRLLAGDATARDNSYTIHFSYAAQGWVRGVHSYQAFGSHIALDNSTQIEVTGCYLENAHEYDDGGSGYGVKVQSRSGECLIENNIFRVLRHSILLQAGANGNVFGYNYSRDTKSDSHPSWAGDIALHGNYPYANLFEGNIVEHLWIDNSHNGIHGPLNTFFRNRAENCGFNMTDLNAKSQNVVGNELFRGDFLAQIAVGNGYHFEGGDHFTYGNNTESSGLQPPGTNALADYSYYWNADPLALPIIPGWWTISDALPIIGPPRDFAPEKNNPARARWFSGGTLTVGPVTPGSTYTLTAAVTPPGGGTITINPDKVEYTVGETVILTATPAAGYHFTGWSGNATGSTNPITITMNNNKNITAAMAETSTASGGGGGGGAAGPLAIAVSVLLSRWKRRKKD
ncbi:MAG: glycosyl hydrolase family 28-related protein [Candidatus Omnitrophica bacterium]|nr:glycosyl hydrolase family 28-related protein [Candidatus Omnitrophota bacterium]